MKVYLVYELVPHTTNDFEVVAIFDSEQKAIDYVTEHGTLLTMHYESMEVQ